MVKVPHKIYKGHGAPQNPGLRSFYRTRFWGQRFETKTFFFRDFGKLFFSYYIKECKKTSSLKSILMQDSSRFVNAIKNG